MLKIGDYVTRKKYGNDILFKIDKIENNTIYLKGVDVRLYADSEKEDLILSSISKKKRKFWDNKAIKYKRFFLYSRYNTAFRLWSRIYRQV